MSSADEECTGRQDKELRISDSEGAVRIFYFTFTGKRITLLHGFIKKTERTPLKEIGIAEKRMNDFIDRGRGQL